MTEQFFFYQYNFDNTAPSTLTYKSGRVAKDGSFTYYEQDNCAGASSTCSDCGPDCDAYDYSSTCKIMGNLQNYGYFSLTGKYSPECPVDMSINATLYKRSDTSCSETSQGTNIIGANTCFYIDTDEGQNIFAKGVVSPIPTFPELSMRTLSVASLAEPVLLTLKVKNPRLETII